MSAITFTIPIKKLRAAALFTTDDHRHVLTGVWIERQAENCILMVATDGKRMVVIRECCEPIDDFIPFIMPRELIDLVKAPDGLDVEVTHDYVSGEITIKGAGFAWIGKAIKGNYPNWRGVMPKPEEPLVLTPVRLSGELLAGFTEAAKLLSSRHRTCLEIFPYGDTPTAPSAFRICIQGEQDFFGILMPMKLGDNETAPPLVPDWLRKGAV